MLTDITAVANDTSADAKERSMQAGCSVEVIGTTSGKYDGRRGVLVQLLVVNNDTAWKVKLDTRPNEYVEKKNFHVKNVKLVRTSNTLLVTTPDRVWRFQCDGKNSLFSRSSYKSWKEIFDKCKGKTPEQLEKAFPPPEE